MHILGTKRRALPSEVEIEYDSDANNPYYNNSELVSAAMDHIKNS